MTKDVWRNFYAMMDEQQRINERDELKAKILSPQSRYLPRNVKRMLIFRMREILYYIPNGKEKWGCAGYQQN